MSRKPSVQSQVIITITQIDKEVHVDVQYRPAVDLTAGAKVPFAHKVAGIALKSISRAILGR